MNAHIRIGLIVGWLAFASLPAPAEEPEQGRPTVDEQVLEILREQGAIDDARYEELKRQAEEERARRQERAEQQQEAAEPDPAGWKLVYKDGLGFERNDGQFKFRVGGRVQLDFAGVAQEHTLQGLVDNVGTGVDFRRARLFAEGSFGEHAIFKGEYDFAGDGDPTFADVFVGLQRLPWIGRVRAGHIKEPMSLEEQTSSNFTTFVERALPVLAFSPARNTGIGINNTAFDERVTWAVGGYRDVDNFGEDFGDDSDYNTTARITGLPLWQDDGARLVHVGASYSHRFRNEDTIAFGPRPEVNTSTPLVATGSIPTEGADVFGAELAAVFGPLAIQGEFLDALVDGEDSGTRNFYGAYGQVSYFLTGEQRVYDPKSGAFTRTRPLEPFSVSEGRWGAFELAARYSFIDLNDDSVRGGIQSDVTTGINWYLYSNFRVMVNWVHAHRKGTGNQDAAIARVALDF